MSLKRKPDVSCNCNESHEGECSTKKPKILEIIPTTSNGTILFSEHAKNIVDDFQNLMEYRLKGPKVDQAFCEVLYEKDISYYGYYRFLKWLYDKDDHPNIVEERLWSTFFQMQGCKEDNLYPTVKPALLAYYLWRQSEDEKPKCQLYKEEKNRCKKYLKHGYFM